MHLEHFYYELIYLNVNLFKFQYQYIQYQVLSPEAIHIQVTYELSRLCLYTW